MSPAIPVSRDRLRASVEVGEQFARGEATAEELAAAHAAAREAYATLDGHDMDLEYRKQCEAWAAAVAASGPSGAGAVSTATGTHYWRDELAAAGLDAPPDGGRV